MYSKAIVLILLMFFIVFPTCSQQYMNFVGIRLGNTKAIAYKKFVQEDQAFEFMLGNRNSGANVISTFQWYKNLESKVSANIFFYYGIGAHFGYLREFAERYYYDFETKGLEYESGKKTYFAFGPTGIMGLEYRIYAVPLAIGLEIKPYLSYYGLRYVKADLWDTGFTVKYIF